MEPKKWIIVVLVGATMMSWSCDSGQADAYRVREPLPMQRRKLLYRGCLRKPHPEDASHLESD
jgi:hypothetical protein